MTSEQRHKWFAVALMLACLGLMAWGFAPVAKTIQWRAATPAPLTTNWLGSITFAERWRDTITIGTNTFPVTGSLQTKVAEDIIIGLRSDGVVVWKTK